MRTPGARIHCKSFDGMRGIAILAVMAFHQELPGFDRGFLGVDLFLVLSGFLITSLLAQEFAERGTVSLRSFWIRRVLRLAPLYLLYVSLLTLGYVSGVFHFDGDGAATHLLENWLYARNLHVTSEAEIYWNDVGISGHLWSLSLEEQFYLLWPFLCLFILRGGPRRRLLIPLLLSLHVVALLRAQHWYDAAFPPWTRGLSLSAGCAVALGLEWYPGFVRRIERPWLQPVCAVLVVGIWSALTLSPWCEMLEAHKYVLPVLLLPLTLLCGGLWRNQSTLVSRALSLAPLAYLGRISYGVYMWHMLCFAVMMGLVASEPLRMVLTPLCTVALAAASYAFYEKPFLRAKRRFSFNEPPVALPAMTSAEPSALAQ